MNRTYGKSVVDSKGTLSAFFSLEKAQADFFSTENQTPVGGGKIRSRSGMRCVVCGDVSSGKHYGVLACNGCSGFFKRSVRRKLVYRCQAASGQCIVDKAHRNQCQACRLRKCLECGMNRDAVQNERQPRNTATIRPESAFAIPISSGEDVYSNRSDTKCVNLTTFPPIFPLHQKLVPPLFVKVNTSKLTDTFVSSKERMSAGMEEALKKETFYPLGYPSFFAHDGRGETPLDATKSSLYETSARILLLSIRWARNLPSYSSLALQDQAPSLALQFIMGLYAIHRFPLSLDGPDDNLLSSYLNNKPVALLEETWSELFLISCIQWSMPLDSNPLFAAMGTSLSLNNMQQKKCTQILQKMFARFKMLAVDFSEFACLKAIILFRPDAESLKDNHQVEMLHDHAQLMLAHHIKSQHFDYTFRFGRLLLLLPSLRQLPPDIIESLFFSKTIGSTPIVKLLGDLFKC